MRATGSNPSNCDDSVAVNDRIIGRRKNRIKKRDCCICNSPFWRKRWDWEPNFGAREVWRQFRLLFVAPRQAVASLRMGSSSASASIKTKRGAICTPFRFGGSGGIFASLRSLPRRRKTLPRSILLPPLRGSLLVRFPPDKNTGNGKSVPCIFGGSGGIRTHEPLRAT